MNQFLLLLRRVFADISGWLAFFVTVFISLDVVLRYFLSASIPAGMEFTQVLLVLMVFFAFGQAQAGKVHVRVEFVIEKLPARLRRFWEVVVHFLALVFFGFIFWEAIWFFLDSWKMGEYYGGAVRVPIYPARGAIVIGCGLMVIELVRDLLSMLGRTGGAAFVPSIEQREIEETIAKIEEESKQKA